MGVLLAFLGSFVAACCDIESRRVPNLLIIFMWAGGAALAVAATRDPASALAGAVLPVIVLWPLWRRQAMGAGDIKLLSGLGSLLGMRAVAAVFAAAVICAGVISAGLILEEGFAAARRAGVHFAVPVFMGVLLTVGQDLC